MSKKSERELEAEVKKYQARLQMSDTELQEKKRAWEAERRQLLDQIQELEREKVTLVTSDSVQSHKLSYLQEEKLRLEERISSLQSELKAAQAAAHESHAAQVKDLEKLIDGLKTENIKQNAQFEKQLALLQQQNEFLKRDLESKQVLNSTLEDAVKRMREELTSANSLADVSPRPPSTRKARPFITSFQRKRSASAGQANSECVRAGGGDSVLRDGWVKLEVVPANSSKHPARARLVQVCKSKQDQIKQLMDENEKKKDVIKQHSDWQIEKTYLEDQIQFYKNQLDENKRLHDALYIALQRKPRLPLPRLAPGALLRWRAIATLR